MDTPTPNTAAKPNFRLTVRPAELRDVTDIARIYLQARQDNLATFENFLLTDEERARWVSEHTGKYPLLVAELNGWILGWAALSPYLVRPSADGIAELLIYIDRDYRRHGVGRELMHAVLTLAESVGHFKLVGRFLAHNDAGRRLCRMTGWREVGVHVNHTKVGGHWHDVAVVEYLIPKNLK
jgi:phosphinothricin acetyltransferase